MKCKVGKSGTFREDVTAHIQEADQMNVPPYRHVIARQYRKLVHVYDCCEIVASGIRKEIARFAGTAPKQVLDVACGTGSQARILAGSGHTVCGIDLTRAMLERAIKKCNRYGQAFFIEGDASRMPFRGESFDISVVSLAIHEIPAETALKVLAEMKRVTRPGGHIIIIELNKKKGLFGNILYTFLRWIEPPYFLDYMRRGLFAYIEDAGLPVLSIERRFFDSIYIVICSPR